MPAPIRWVSQPVLCRLLTCLANYHVELEGNLPDYPALLGSYPHRQHADSLVLHEVVRRLSVMGGADHWFHTDKVRQLGVSAIVSTIPLLRSDKEEGGVGRTDRNRELAMVEAALRRGDKVNWYVTGSRVGAAQSWEEFTTPGLKAIKPGIAKHAQQLQVPVIPLGFIYPADYQPSRLNQVPDAWHNFLHRLSGGGRRVDIMIRAGEPLDPPAELGNTIENKKARTVFLGQLAAALWELAHSAEAQTIANNLSKQTSTR